MIVSINCKQPTLKSLSTDATKTLRMDYTNLRRAGRMSNEYCNTFMQYNIGKIDWTIFQSEKDLEYIREILKVIDINTLDKPTRILDALCALQPIADTIEWTNIVDEFDVENPPQFGMDILSAMPSAIEMLENRLQFVNWDNLSLNPAAVHLLEQNPEKINWANLSFNPAALHLLEARPDLIHFNNARGLVTEIVYCLNAIV